LTGILEIAPGAIRIIVPALVTGEESHRLGLKLLLDTEASMTTLPEDALLKLGYAPAEAKDKRRVATGSSVEDLPVLTVKSMTVLEHTVTDLDVLCLDLPARAGVDGLLGMNFLNRFDTSTLF